MECSCNLWGFIICTSFWQYIKPGYWSEPVGPECGIQRNILAIFTNVNGPGPWIKPETPCLSFDLMAELDPSSGFILSAAPTSPDYKSENEEPLRDLVDPRLGPSRPSVAPMAPYRLRPGLFESHPNLKSFTHHLWSHDPLLRGACSVRVGPDWDGTSDEDYFALLKSMKITPPDYFKLFTPTQGRFRRGPYRATVCGLRILRRRQGALASDMPSILKARRWYIPVEIDAIDHSAILLRAERHAIL